MLFYHFTLVFCARPDEPENGFYDPFDGYDFEQLPGGNVTFRCRDRFRLVGSERIICQDDGTWNASTPTCESTDGKIDFRFSILKRRFDVRMNASQTSFFIYIFLSSTQTFNFMR